MFSFPNPGAFFGPADMLAVYKNLPVVTPDGPVTVSIDQYRNANNPPSQGGTADAWVIKQSLLSAVPDALQRAGGAVPYVDVFLGKGAPQTIVAVLQTFVDRADLFCQRHAKASRQSPTGQCVALLADTSISWQDTVQGICDRWLGLDCNGFVGNWLKVVAPEFKLNQNSRADDVRRKARAYRRSVGEIEYWDVMCYTKNEHIAAVNGNGQAPGSFEVCQSAGGGPRSNEYRFIQVTQDSFVLASPTKGDIGRAFYVVSLW